MSELSLSSEKKIADLFKVINRLADRGELAQARKLCESLYNEYPQHPRVMHGMGLLQYRTGDLEEGEKLVRQAIEKYPEFSGAYESLGKILCYSLHFEEAEQLYRKLLELEPDNLRAMELLAQVLVHRDNYQESLELCYKIILKNPKSVSAYATFGHVMMSFGKPLEGLNYLKKSLSLQKVGATHSGLLFLLNLLSSVTQKDIFEESVRWGKLYTGRLAKKARKHFNYPAPYRKLRIGYVSGDFRKHPVGYHLRPVLAAHDQSIFDIFIYNAFPNCDAMTEEFASNAVCYRDVSLKSDDAVESIIREDGIDILVDLAGHTAFNRLSLFARKPAPVQVSWIGYFNTTGVSAMDYFISDPVTTPDSDDKYFTEKIIRLPNVRFCYEPQPYAPKVADLPAVKNNFITFGSFNAIHKMMPQVLKLWSKVLHAIPGSRMLIKSKSFKEKRVIEDFICRFNELGISEDRLELRTASEHAKMLAEYGDMDISLDTFPYNGGATTCESLWMGVPVITIAGGTPIGRQTQAYLNTIGYSEWIANSEDEFIDIAVKLASNISYLAMIRSKLREKMAESALCDGVTFTRNLEAAYRTIWINWCDKKTSNTTELPYLTHVLSIDELCAIGFNYIKDHQILLAEKVFKRVLRRDHSHVRGLNGLGVVSEVSGNKVRAVRFYKRALRIAPNNAETSFNLGCFYIDQRQYYNAIKALSCAVKNKPEYSAAWLNLGIAYNLNGCSEDACNSFSKILQFESDHSVARRQLAWGLASIGRVPQALLEIKKALLKKTNDLESLCIYLHLLSYAETTTQAELSSVSLKAGEIIQSYSNHSCNISNRIYSSKKNRLKIGFVSNDFIAHPIGMLLIPFVASHNPDKLELYCYNNGLTRDHVTAWLSSNVEGWRDIFSLNDCEAAATIQNDGIDVLIDLNGYTHRHRLQLFSLQPAPVQASWLGYWHTTGMKCIDYFIGDADFILPEDEQWFTEKVVRLPDNRFCYQPPNPCPDVVELPCIANNYVTFGCFSNPVKITDTAVRVWANILHSVPHSRLVLKFKTFKDKSVCRHFIEMFRNYGIQRKRIEFRLGSSLYLMMVELGDVDICLDTFPFSGGMTSLHSFWMGVPVVTLAGEMPVSRQTKSFLKNLGLPELVAHTEIEYQEIAVKLANNKEQLNTMRMSLRDKMFNSPLCDNERYAQNVENILFEMWNNVDMLNKNCNI